MENQTLKALLANSRLLILGQGIKIEKINLQKRSHKKVKRIFLIFFSFNYMHKALINLSYCNTGNNRGKMIM